MEMVDHLKKPNKINMFIKINLTKTISAIVISIKFYKIAGKIKIYLKEIAKRNLRMHITPIKLS
jgi:hypothetical protein